ncbi:MAG: class II glutamine amidotransferase [Armatimonadota bacterium]
MCRLVGIAGPAPAPLPSHDHLVTAPHALRVQADLGRVLPGGEPGHRDSWGIGWIDAEGRPSVLRQVGSAMESPSFVFGAETASRGSAASGPARVLIGHLRKAVAGEITTGNAHPFSVETAAGPLLFAHNGHVRESLLKSVRADLAAQGDHVGADADCDSQVLAHWIGGRIDPFQDGAGIPGALAELIDRARTLEEPHEAYTGMILLMALPAGLSVLRWYSRWPEYYTLHHRRDGDCDIVASEPTDTSPDWTLLEAGVLHRFDRDGGPVRTWRVVEPTGDTA